jgi:hypothetical protein
LIVLHDFFLFLLKMSRQAMGSSPVGPRREWGVNVQIRADRGGGGSPGL